MVVVAYLIFDYFNVFSALGIETSNLNLGVFSTVINSVIVIALYIITFEFVDKKNEKRNKNKEEVAAQLLITIYSECLKNIDIMCDPDLYCKVTRFVDPDKLIEKDNKFRVFENLPFDNESDLIDFFKEGTLSSEDFKKYMDNKSNYRMFMSVSLIFPDFSEKVNIYKVKACSVLNDTIKQLNVRLES